MSTVRGVLSCRKVLTRASRKNEPNFRAPHRLHHTARARQGRRPKSYPAPHAGSRPARAGFSEFRVVDRIQSSPQDSGLPIHGFADRGSASFRPLQSALVGLLIVYKRVISPFLPSACRFHPTCSDYMRQAIQLHGPAQGVWLGLKRLGRCHPFHEGGFDPVPHGLPTTRRG